MLVSTTQQRNKDHRQTIERESCTYAAVVCVGSRMQLIRVDYSKTIIAQYFWKKLYNAHLSR
jgi:hypothetical protein